MRPVKISRWGVDIMARVCRHSVSGRLQPRGRWNRLVIAGESEVVVAGVDVAYDRV